MSREPGDGEGQGNGSRKRARRPRPSPSQLSPQDAYDHALAAATRLLSHRERSRRELTTRLRQKGYTQATIDLALERLSESGLQDDRRFAETFAAGAQRGKGLSAFAIQGELRRRGIEPTLAAEASTEAPEDEEERARKLAFARAARMGNLAPEAVRRRLEAFLARRGYPGEMARRLAAEASGEVSEGPR